MKTAPTASLDTAAIHGDIAEAERHFLPPGSVILPPTLRLLPPLAKPARPVGLDDAVTALGVSRGIIEALMKRQRWAATQTEADGTRRFLLTPLGIAAGIGVNAVRRSARRYRFVSLAPVGLARIAVALGWPSVLEGLAAAIGKKARADFVLDALRWLPMTEQANLTGYTPAGWRRLVARKVSLFE